MLTEWLDWLTESVNDEADCRTAPAPGQLIIHKYTLHFPGDSGLLRDQPGGQRCRRSLGAELLDGPTAKVLWPAFLL